MLRFLFPRLFGQYREGGLIVGKFLVSNSGATLTPVTDPSPGNHESHPLLSAAGDSGQYVVTLLGGAKQITVVGVHASLMDLDDPNDARVVLLDEETGIDLTAGTIPITAISLAATPAVADLPDGSVLTITLYVSK